MSCPRDFPHGDPCSVREATLVVLRYEFLHSPRIDRQALAAAPSPISNYRPALCAQTAWVLGGAAKILYNMRPCPPRHCALLRLPRRRARWRRRSPRRASSTPASEWHPPVRLRRASGCRGRGAHRARRRGQAQRRRRWTRRRSPPPATALHGTLRLAHGCRPHTRLAPSRLRPGWWMPPRGRSATRLYCKLSARPGSFGAR
mmetsp:Transcript_50971/g.131426  ORF Transcript_50971/g.131426 Transcript_50971/m.131426 type:complete len:202 (+) Transcript_50971:196-801(+)